MKFEHNLLPRFELESEDTPNGRIYKSPIGPLQSVTTIIGNSLDKSWLKKWEKNIGKEEAEKIRQKASNRGNDLHDMLERYLLNEEIDLRSLMPFNKHAFNHAKKVLDENINLIYGTEFPIWSKYIQTAGRIDVVGQWNGIDSIIDFKNSRRSKDLQKLIDAGYFYQTTAYSIALEEQTGMSAKQMVIILMEEHEDTKVFIQDRKDYLNKTIKIFRGISI